MNKNNKNFGFTLTEVLIALGIIGVISAIVIPTAITAIQNKQLPLMLGKNVASVETGCLKMIQRASELSANGDFLGHYNIHKNLDGSTIGTNPENSISGNNLFTGTGAFFDTKTLSDDEISQYISAVKAFSGNNASPPVSSLVNKKIVANTKTGAFLGASTFGKSEEAPDPIVGYIYIDVNGANSPNRYGRDIFLYGLTDACKMIPAGSERMHNINNNIPLESTGCNGNEIKNGLSCTSRIVKEGYKMSY
ncbi:MAG: type II secretion system GspH family protein [bacterium]|nr:type II secretion system GspH family protein [bacterium]